MTIENTIQSDMPLFHRSSYCQHIIILIGHDCISALTTHTQACNSTGTQYLESIAREPRRALFKNLRMLLVLQSTLNNKVPERSKVMRSVRCSLVSLATSTSP